MIEAKFAARFAVAEKRVDAAEARAHATGSALTELRAQVRNDVVDLTNELGARVRDASVAGVELRAEVEAKFEAPLKAAEKRAEAAEALLHKLNQRLGHGRQAAE